MNVNKNAIKRKLESKKCRTHGEHPVVSVTSSGFSFKCCCDKFRSELVRESEKLLSEAVNKSINDTLKKTFK